MKKYFAILILFALYYFTRSAVKSDIDDALNNKNVLAFLAMIRRYESADDYYVLYGGTHFDDTSKHPDIKIPFVNPATGRNDYSTAAGAYQINFPTWLTVQAVALLPDFSKESQDAAAVWLLKLRGILPDVISGNFRDAITTASKTWASLPFSNARQNPVQYKNALATYINNGGAETTA